MSAGLLQLRRAAWLPRCREGLTLRHIFKAVMPLCRRMPRHRPQYWPAQGKIALMAARREAAAECYALYGQDVMRHCPTFSFAYMPTAATAKYSEKDYRP